MLLLHSQDLTELLSQMEQLELLRLLNPLHLSANRAVLPLEILFQHRHILPRCLRLIDLQ